MKLPKPLAAGCGAALGALCRWGLGFVLPNVWLVVFVNIVGSFAMGRLRPGVFWGTGFLGGFTSFSSFTAVMLAADTSPVFALVYVVLTVVGCVGAWLLGDRWAQR